MDAKLPSRPATTGEIIPSTEHRHGIEADGERPRAGAGKGAGEEGEGHDYRGDDDKEEEEGSSGYTSDFENDLFPLTASITDYL